ncbi:MSMEG_0567/Sll0786 family nitrogen starvation N-acetyltransferase [Agarilytica rhodophyticola]|uniref:MSMEG_0567/Sll0786 family nitrogen starvation N-acetyltransferase n=1 Tax=Agarilytica rhodophyticola TaxID=1737490 RepID=UPI000B34135B|nr:MSMEG_0567/Sll0786 family nitrogen starvation N-acetyltransferase [Agarilytica rhodophyticola]
MATQNYALIDDVFTPFKSAHLKIKVAKSAWEKQGYFQLRKQIFSQEQKLLPNNEKDAEDFRAIAIIALANAWSIGDDIVGAVRIFQSQHEVNTWYGGRLCVNQTYRRHLGIGKALINEAVSLAKDQGCENFLANVQVQNEKYFQQLYWQSIESCDIAGHPHILMKAQMDKYPIMSRDTV